LKPKILYIDDEVYSSNIYEECLQDNGFDVTLVHNVHKALQIAKQTQFDVIITDVMMPFGKSFSAIETAGGYKTGIALCRELREFLPDSLFVALTLSTDPEVLEWFSQSENYLYFNKSTIPNSVFAKKIKNRFLRIKETPTVFIVHGHDLNSAYELKKLLENELQFGEPIILSEKPSKGKTIIEKFEYYAKLTDIVFAIFSPDDILSNGDKQARPNVIFEFGYFLGQLGRHHGKVFLLHHNKSVIPSDLHGLVYIDITKGISSALPNIKRELLDFL
jgi:CheY-like chemotaxis protein